jgi:hypothetical protein
MIFGEFYGK